MSIIKQRHTSIVNWNEYSNYISNVALSLEDYLQGCFLFVIYTVTYLAHEGSNNIIVQLHHKYLHLTCLYPVLLYLDTDRFVRDNLPKMITR